MVQPEEIKIFLEPLNISMKQFVFFALNDNNSPDMAGGSHWSLLVYSKMESCFFHLDSSSGSNHNVAWDFASHLMSYLAKQGTISFSDKECQQQSNGYDCGIHVICNTEVLAHWASKYREIGSCDMKIKVNPNQKRKEIMNIIKSLVNMK
ncbi:Sentrin-specific protease 8 [Papilio xuthus]|uniref:Sentrin-specific protease 8 n=1 Tax=Papilio xuthus TaxID=66420 RepID=A0A194PVH9_PAPXU|nr:Sentrin-specific protease 8 [Papilio xuthus]